MVSGSVYNSKERIMERSQDKMEKLAQSAKSKFFVAAKFPKPKPGKDAKDGKEVSDMSGFVLSLTAGLERDIVLDEVKKTVDSNLQTWPNASDYYDLNEPLGAGNYGVTYLATCIPQKEKCAVKIIQLQQFGSIRNTILRDVQTMASFSHENVMSYYSTFVDKQQLWFILKYMENGSVLSLMRQKRKISSCSTGIFDEPVIATIIMGVVSGLEYLHSSGYIHRDIKANNILVAADGSVKISDFIIPHSLSQTKKFVGSPYWLAPEMIDNSERKYTVKADVWSLGITAIEIATGLPPYKKLPSMKVLLMTLLNEPPNLETVAEYRDQYSRYGKTFRSFISDCLKKDPAERPLSTELLFHPFFKKAKDQKFLEQEFASITTMQPPVIHKKKVQNNPYIPIKQRKPWILNWTDEHVTSNKELLPLRPSIPPVLEEGQFLNQTIQNRKFPSGSDKLEHYNPTHFVFTLKIRGLHLDSPMILRTGIQPKRDLFDIIFEYVPSKDNPSLIAMDLVRDGLIDPKDQQAVATNLQNLIDNPTQQSVVFPLVLIRMKTILAIFATCAVVTLTSAHTYHLGNCPAVEPMSDFQMSKFLGLWYAVQKTSTGSRCLTYNFTSSAEPGEFLLEQVSEHPVLGVASVDNKYHYSGQLTASQDVPARMSVRFPLNPAGSASFIVFMTDYDNYAGIYTCQKLPASNRRSATILSRKKTLEKMVVDKIRNRMSQFGVSPYDLSIIDQTKCPGLYEETNVDVNINPETFSSQNIAGVVRKAGEKIGDGIESAADGISKVYHGLKTDKKDEFDDFP